MVIIITARKDVDVSKTCEISMKLWNMENILGKTWIFHTLSIASNSLKIFQPN